MGRLLAGALGVAMIPVAVAAQEVCATRAALLDSLTEDYQETPAAVGMSNNGGVMEVFTARDGRTWTILLTRPDGNSCILATGELWTPVPQQLATTDNTI
jgi:hypothetical protein